MARSLGVWLTPVIVVVLAGCSPGGEQTLLGQFFAASRLRDKTMLSNFSTVAFEPATQGIVTTFTITNVGREEQHEGGIVSKDVTIAAPVRVPSGQTVQKMLVVTLRRAEQRTNQPTTSRWIVTGVKDAAAGATPRS
jgi:hypothetical protein